MLISDLDCCSLMTVVVVDELRRIVFLLSNTYAECLIMLGRLIEKDSAVEKGIHVRRSGKTVA